MARSICIGMLFLFFFGGQLAPYDPLVTRPEQATVAPSTRYGLGTDLLGRDVMSRVLYGGRTTIFLAIGAAAIGLGAGLVLGIIKTFGVGFTRNIAISLELLLLSLPAWLMALVFVAGVGASWKAVIIGVGITQIAPFSRIVTMTITQIRSQLFVTASEASGASGAYIVLQVLLPNASPVLVGSACVTLSNGLLFASGLTFLGLGGETSTPEWGTMLAEGRLAMRYAPWIALAAGIPLVLLIASLNAIGRRFSLRGWLS